MPLITNHCTLESLHARMADDDNWLVVKYGRQSEAKRLFIGAVISRLKEEGVSDPYRALEAVVRKTKTAGLSLAEIAGLVLDRAKND